MHPQKWAGVRGLRAALIRSYCLQHSALGLQQGSLATLNVMFNIDCQLDSF